MHTAVAEKRESRMFWTFDKARVFEVLGFSCAPENPGVWWCPKVGYSLTEGFTLFPTQDEARSAAIAQSVLDALEAAA